jgi:hypothetical protein
MTYITQSSDVEGKLSNLSHASPLAEKRHIKFEGSG